MTCEEVTISLHDYVDDLLDDNTKREVEQHIRNCDVCIREYKKLVGFFDRLKEIPIVIDPPKEIIEDVRLHLLNLSEASQIANSKISFENDRRINKERARQEKELKKKGPLSRKIKNTHKIIAQKPYRVKSNLNLKRTLISILPLVIIAIGYVVYDIHKYNYPWKVASIEGVQKIDGSVNQNNLWNQGSVLSTDKTARALVNVPNVGRLEIGNDSRLVLEIAKDGMNRVNIEKGSVRIINTNNMPEFSIAAGNSIIIDQGGEFKVDVNNNGNAKVSVKFGFVIVEYNDEQYYISGNYNCDIRAGKKPGIPYHKDALDTLKSAVEMFNNSNGDETAIEKIISSHKENDVLTLLALIPRVSQLQRQILFQEISNHFPPPESITRAGIIRLDKDMLYKWWEEIEWQI